MFVLPTSPATKRLIQITKSDSGVSGPGLVLAHMELGYRLGLQIPFPPEETTVVAILRGGICFALGMYIAMGCRFQTYEPKLEEFSPPETKYTILADSVINTGKTILPLLTDNTFAACCVASEEAARLLDDRLYTVRVSANSFVGQAVRKQQGAIGPDTTMRLFNLL